MKLTVSELPLDGMLDYLKLPHPSYLLVSTYTSGEEMMWGGVTLSKNSKGEQGTGNNNNNVFCPVL